MSMWDALDKDERLQILAFDELERERRSKSIKDGAGEMNTETLLAWIYHEG